MMIWGKNRGAKVGRASISDFPQADWWLTLNKTSNKRSDTEAYRGLVVSMKTSGFYHWKADGILPAPSFVIREFSTDGVANLFSDRAFQNPYDRSLKDQGLDGLEVFAPPWPADIGDVTDIPTEGDSAKDADSNEVFDQLAILTGNESLVVPVLPENAACPNKSPDHEEAVRVQEDAKVIIGVIDDGIAIAQKVFRLPDNTIRFASLWQQDADCDGAPSRRPFGRVFTEEEINTGFEAAGFSEPEFYENMNLRIGGHRGDNLARKRLHGTHVAGLAAGNIPQAAEVDDQINAHPEEYPIIGVNLPTSVVVDTAGSFLSAGVILGIEYILETAARISSSAPVVINLSFALLGSGLGGADLISRYIDQVSEDWCKAGRTLLFVLPAGNNFEDNVVGRMEKIPAKGSGRAQIEIERDTATSTFVEFIIERQRPLTPQSEVRLEISSDVLGDTTYDEPITETVELRSTWHLRRDATRADPVLGALYHGFRLESEGFTYHPSTVGAPKFGREVLTLALPPDRAVDGVRTAGTWTATLHNLSDEEMDVTVRILRNDDLMAKTFKQTARLRPINDERAGDCDLTNLSTISTMAKSGKAVVVGSSLFGGSGMSPYSASGPLMTLDGRDVQPGVDLHVPVDRPGEKRTVLGPEALTPPGSDGRDVKMTGTSVAAPIVTRWLVNRLSQSDRMTCDEAIDALLEEARKQPSTAKLDPDGYRSGVGGLQEYLSGPT